MDNLAIPGLGDFLSNDEDEQDYFTEGAPGKRFFDATQLPDAPQYQRNAENNQTYVLHLVFPSHEELRRAIEAMSLGQRKILTITAKEGKINGIAINKKNGFTWLETWEQILLGKKPIKKKIAPEIVEDEQADEDEVHAPVE